VGSNGSIGRPVRCREDARILSGRSQFLDDVRLDGMAHVTSLQR
jgi:hypothetical protein